MIMKKSLLLLALLMIGGGFTWWQLRPAPPIQVGMIAWIASGAVIGSSEIHESDLFLEEHPHSRIRVIPVDDEWQPEQTAAIVQAALAQGIRFFISTHPSNCAVKSVHLFADSQAVLINTSSTTPVLTGRDDGILRIVPDVIQEQRAIADYVNALPGKRLLVLQDTGNLAYSAPGFAAFAAKLSTVNHWQLDHHAMLMSAFNPEQERQLMAQPFDVLYILGGSFQSDIGNIAQLFHYFHPDAPIVLTPWARSPAILETSGDAIDHIILVSTYPPREVNTEIDHYFNRFAARFGYKPHAMTIEVRQALELLDQAFALGYDTPEAVKRYLLGTPTHHTSLGIISFDRFGDVTRPYYFIRDLRNELK